MKHFSDLFLLFLVTIMSAAYAEESVRDGSPLPGPSALQIQARVYAKDKAAQNFILAVRDGVKSWHLKNVKKGNVVPNSQLVLVLMRGVSEFGNLVILVQGRIIDAKGVELEISKNTAVWMECGVEEAVKYVIHTILWATGQRPANLPPQVRPETKPTLTKGLRTAFAQPRAAPKQPRFFISDIERACLPVGRSVTFVTSEPRS